MINCVLKLIVAWRGFACDSMGLCNFISSVSVDRIQQGCARGLFSRDRGETETKAFRARHRDEAEAY